MKKLLFGIAIIFASSMNVFSAPSLEREMKLAVLKAGHDLSTKQLSYTEEEMHKISLSAIKASEIGQNAKDCLIKFGNIELYSTAANAVLGAIEVKQHLVDWHPTEAYSQDELKKIDSVFYYIHRDGEKQALEGYKKVELVVKELAKECQVSAPR